MNYDTILLEIKNHVAILTLNQPKVLNAISPEMLLEIKMPLHLLNSQGKKSGVSWLRGPDADSVPGPILAKRNRTKNHCLGKSIWRTGRRCF